MEIRVATSADLEQMALLKTELVRTWFDDPSAVDQNPKYPQQLSERLNELFHNPWYRYWVAENDGQIVAMMSAGITKHLPGPDWSGISSHLADLYVVPEYRGQSIASKLMDEALAWSKAQGAFSADMHATKMAVPMYLAKGWEAVNPDEIGERFTSMHCLLVDLPKPDHN